MQNITILLPAHDSYKDIVEIWCNEKNKIWPQCPYEIKWCNGKETIEDKFVEVINTKEDAGFCERVLIALEKIKTKYVILWVEDFIITDSINTEILESIVQYMDMNAYKHCRLFKGSHKNTKKTSIDNLYICNSNKPYAVSINVGIFEKEYLKDIISECSTGWELENRFLEKAFKGEIVDCLYHDGNLGGLVHLVQQGQILPFALRFSKLDYHFDRPIMKLRKQIKYSILTLISKVFPMKFRKYMKTLLSHIGIRTITKY